MKSNKSLFSLIAAVCMIVIVAFCSIQMIDPHMENNSSGGSSQNESSDEITNPDESGSQDEEDYTDDLVIKIGDQNFTITLYNNASVTALLNNLPLEITMNELNGNEKYHYLPERLPAHNERVGNIRSGDLMLYGSDCLVLFYESFPTSYSYTRLGYIENPEGLKEALGDGNVRVVFSINE